MHVCISFPCEKECDDLSRINSGIILNHLTTCFSSELILLIHGSGDGGGGVYGGGGVGSSWCSNYKCMFLVL